MGSVSAYLLFIFGSHLSLQQPYAFRISELRLHLCEAWSLSRGVGGVGWDGGVGLLRCAGASGQNPAAEATNAE